MKMRLDPPLKTLDLLGLLALVLMVVTLPALIVRGRILEFEDERVRHQIEAASFRFTRQYRADSDRQPSAAAEERILGEDPWGHPLQFQSLFDTNGVLQGLAVWSLGRNGINETRPAGAEHFEFSGDDIGVITPREAPR